MQFQAVIGGKVVSYPMTARFEIQQRTSGHKYEYAGERFNISDALSRFHAVERSGLQARILSVVGNRKKVLVKS